MPDDDVEHVQIDTTVRVVTLICLTIIVVTAIVGITITAVMTDRNVRYAEGLSFAGAVLIAVLGGFTLTSLRRHRHRRWRIEHDENGDDT